MSVENAIRCELETLVRQMASEGVLDDQFQQLLALQDESNPDFVREVVTLYFEDSMGKIERVQQLLNGPSPDYAELDAIVHQFKGSSASLGATHITQLCIKLREACQAQNVAACAALVAQVREAYALLQARLQVFLQLEARHKAALAAG
jgi:histidine-containing phosphotransfer peotein